MQTLPRKPQIVKRLPSEQFRRNRAAVLKAGFAVTHSQAGAVQVNGAPVARHLFEQLHPIEIVALLADKIGLPGAGGGE